MQNQLEDLIDVEPVFTTLAVGDGVAPTVDGDKWVCKTDGHPSLNTVANVCMKECNPKEEGKHMFDDACKADALADDATTNLPCIIEAAGGKSINIKHLPDPKAN